MLVPIGDQRSPPAGSGAAAPAFENQKKTVAIKWVFFCTFFSRPAKKKFKQLAMARYSGYKRRRYGYRRRYRSRTRSRRPRYRRLRSRFRRRYRRRSKSIGRAAYSLAKYVARTRPKPEMKHSESQIQAWVNGNSSISIGAFGNDEYYAFDSFFILSQGDDEEKRIGVKIKPRYMKLKMCFSARPFGTLAAETNSPLFSIVTVCLVRAWGTSDTPTALNLTPERIWRYPDHASRSPLVRKRDDGYTMPYRIVYKKTFALRHPLEDDTQYNQTNLMFKEQVREVNVKIRMPKSLQLQYANDSGSIPINQNYILYVGTDTASGSWGTAGVVNFDYFYYDCGFNDN